MWFEFIGRSNSAGSHNFEEGEAGHGKSASQPVDDLITEFGYWRKRMLARIHAPFAMACFCRNHQLQPRLRVDAPSPCFHLVREDLFRLTFACRKLSVVSVQRMTWRDDIDRAVAILRAGGLVAFPTETVYGLGADAENRDAVRRIFTVKGRPLTHPLIVHLNSADDLHHWAESVPDLAKRLAARFWPGPLTLVLRRGARVPLVVTGGLDTVGFRVPDHPVALAMLRKFGGGVAAPSANRFGKVSPTTAAHVRDDLQQLVDLVLDGGPCSVGVESTIVDLSDGEPEILRPGGVTPEELEREFGRPFHIRTGGPVKVPGQHASHYAPKARVVLVRPDEAPARARFFREQGLRVGLITSERIAVPAADSVVVASSNVDLGRRLYAALRNFDQLECAVVLATLPPESGLGLAVADRLRRAAGPRARNESKSE